MRMRKKKWADPYLESHTEYIEQNPVDKKGTWHSYLNCEKLHVEIGMGKGDYLIHMSQMYPSEGWVGIEQDHSAAAVAARKAIEDPAMQKENNHMICGHGEEMEEWFAEKEIDVIHLNFSDPWQKKHYHKRRLSSSKFLNMYKKLLSEDGYIQMKTDNKDLFEDSVLYFLQNGFTLEDISVDFRRDEHKEDAITEYESKFIALNQPIYFLIAKKV